MAELIPATVGAVETDTIASKRIEKIKDVKKIGEVSS